MKMSISDEIKHIYKTSGETVRTMAAMCDCTQATVWNWMNGKTEPSASQMDKLRGLIENETAA